MEPASITAAPDVQNRVPQITVSLSRVGVTDAGRDRVRITGGDGRPRTGLLKVSLGYVDSFVGEGQISYAGPGAAARGRLALEIVAEKLNSEGIRAPSKIVGQAG